MADDNSKLNETSDEIALNYAWNWFQYHANQRLASFNFFLILIGVVVVGYLKCVELAENQAVVNMGMENAWWMLAFSIAIFGVLISIAFWFLDIRNEELVNCGRSALEHLEPKLGLTIRMDDKSRNQLKNSRDLFSYLLPLCFLKYLVRHRLWLRLIMLIIALSFGLAAFFTYHQLAIVLFIIYR